MESREKGGACCIAAAISTPIPGMPKGKPAGVPCVQLADDLSCKIFQSPNRPKVCGGFKAESIICGDSAQEAYSIIASLEGISI